MRDKRERAVFLLLTEYEVIVLKNPTAYIDLKIIRKLARTLCY